MAALTVITSKTGDFCAAGAGFSDNIKLPNSAASSAAACIILRDMVLLISSVPPPTFTGRLLWIIALSRSVFMITWTSSQTCFFAPGFLSR